MAVSETSLINAATQVGLVDVAKVAELKSRARALNCSVLELICRHGRFPMTAIYRALANTRQLPFYDRDDIDIELNLISPFNQQVILRRLFLPVKVAGELVVLSSDPEDKMAVDTVQRTLNNKARLVMADPMMIEAVLRQFFASYSQDFNAISIFNDIMKEAYLRQATDLHFEAIENGMQLRVRVDGRLQHYERPIDKQLADALMSRIKVLAGMDIAEQNMAQDGGFAYVINGWQDIGDIEMRVACIPTRFGERATLRILGQGTQNMKLADLGVPPHLLAPMQQEIKKPYGIVLVTGPTGSGKSTTLYASLRELNAQKMNIMTIEDPIEQVIDNISQIQVSEKLSFSSALRSFLRHDPDVMLVGEIRDKETAETAVRAAMTGHMVMSTLHTNNAVSAINRLIDIGCPAYLIASTLVGVIAQRLLRRNCKHCQKSRPANDAELTVLDSSEPINLYYGTGCSLCLGSGYSGRVGIYETLWMSKSLEQLIHEGASDEALKQQALAENLLHTLWQDAREKVLSGVTSYEEATLLYHA